MDILLNKSQVVVVFVENTTSYGHRVCSCTGQSSVRTVGYTAEHIAILGALSRMSVTISSHECQVFQWNIKYILLLSDL